MKASRLGMIQILLFLIGMAVVSQALIRYEKRQQEDDLIDKGCYLVNLMSLHPMADYRGPNRDIILKIFYENVFSEGLAYALVQDNEGVPLIALDPEKVIPRIPESVHLKTRLSMAFIKESFTPAGSKQKIFEFSRPIFDMGKRSGTIRLGLRAAEVPLFSFKRLWLLATIAFFLFAMVPFFYYGLTLAFRPIRDMNRTFREIGEGTQPEEEISSKGSDVDGVIKNLERSLRFFKEKYKRLEDDCVRLEAGKGLICYETKQFAYILDAVHYGIIITDAQDNVTNINSYMLNLLDKKKEEVVDRPINEVLDHEKVLTFISQMDAIERIRGGSYIEVTFPELAPREIFQVSSSYLRDEEGHITGKIISTRNITREKSAESAKHEFVAQVAHELRAPLNTIKSYNEMLMNEEIGDDETKKEFYNTINDETDRLSRLIENLLNISKMEMGNLTLNPGLVKTEAFVRDVLAAVEGPAQQKHIRIEKNLPDQFPSLVADKELLQVAVINILGNAVKYTPEGGSVTISLSEHEDMVVLDILDTGIGISGEDLPRIFEKFYRSGDQKVREQTGSGLGLAISSDIIQLHEGKLEVESEPGEGTHFTIKLPKEQYYIGR